MNAQTPQLCEKCQQRPATCHITNGHTREKRDLCQTCYKELDSSKGIDLVQLLDALNRVDECRYCGAPSKPGAVEISSFIGGELRLWAYCEQCKQDLEEFARQPGNALPEHFPIDGLAESDELPKQIAERNQRQEAFMKQKVSERKSRGKA